MVLGSGRIGVGAQWQRHAIAYIAKAPHPKRLGDLGSEARGGPRGNVHL